MNPKGLSEKIINQNQQPKRGNQPACARAEFQILSVWRILHFGRHLQQVKHVL